MEKLDAALNNMSHGLCMFGPDDRLLLWNDRYVKMYKLAPDRLRVGCTLDEMLEARKAAGTAYRDLGQYGSKLLRAMTTRSPDNLVAQLDDGRIVNVSYRPTQTAAGFRPTRTSPSARKTKQGSRIWHFTTSSPACRTGRRSTSASQTLSSWRPAMPRLRARFRAI
ncbi:PAS domain-containing protein [Bradyrhizobium sp. AZCC 1610]|uniref:PAS-domain containing protein n=1 Tax=Bradyrhizobium sp. AZCC 1610 TaxID=3117020 RepID=UPI002FF2B74E